MHSWLPDAMLVNAAPTLTSAVHSPADTAGGLMQVNA
jgi:hypothetical protein